MKKTIAPIVRIFTGLVFLLSGLGKVADSWSFAQTASQYVPALISYVAILLPPAELLLGMALLLSFHTRQAAKCIAALTLCYTLFFVFGLLFKDIRDCACFGRLEWASLPPWLLLLRNILLIAAGLWLGVHGHEKETAAGKVLLVTGALAFAVSGFTFGRSFFRKKDDLNKWLRLPRAETPFARLPLAKDKTYVLFLFSPDCPHCWDASANIASWQQAGVVHEAIPVTGLAFRPETRRVFIPAVGRYFKRVLYLGDRQMAQAINNVPGLVMLRNDSVVYVQTGMAASGYRIKYLDPYLNQLKTTNK